MKDEQKWAVYHKPTKLWVFFRLRKDKKDKFGLMTETKICLCLKSDATVSFSKKELKEWLLIGSFNSTPNYGKNNFLEFTIKKV